MLRPTVCQEGGPISRGGQVFTIRRAELELHGEAAFAERKVLSSMREHQVQCLLMGGQACVLYGTAERNAARAAV